MLWAQLPTSILLNDIVSNCLLNRISGNGLVLLSELNKEDSLCSGQWLVKNHNSLKYQGYVSMEGSSTNGTSLSTSPKPREHHKREEDWSEPASSEHDQTTAR